MLRVAERDLNEQSGDVSVTLCALHKNVCTNCIWSESRPRALGWWPMPADSDCRHIVPSPGLEAHVPLLHQDLDQPVARVDTRI